MSLGRTRWQAALVAGLVLVAPHGAALAQEPPLQIDRRGEPRVEADAGSAMTVVFRVTNPAATARVAVTRVEAPAGWQVLFARERLDLEPRSSATEWVTVVPARDAAAGDYVVRYEAGLVPAEMVSASVTIAIRSRREATVEWLTLPTHLLSGQTTTLDLQVTNRSNTPAAVRLAVRSALGSALTASWSEGILAAGEGRRVRVDVSPASRRRGTARERLTATALADQAAASSSASVRFEIVPLMGRSAPAVSARRWPVALTLRGGTHRNPGFGSLTGAGAFDAAGRWGVELGAFSRDRSHPFMIEQDHYAARVWTPALRLTFGDHAWSLSRLTEAGRYGFGGGGEVEWRRVFMGAFLDTGRRDVEQGTQAGGFAGVRIGGAGRVSVQHLTRFDGGLDSARQADLTTVRLHLGPAAGFRSDVEVGTGRSSSGSSGTAFSGELGHVSRYLSWSVRRARADAAYPIRNRTGVVDAVRLGLRPFGQLRVQAAVNATERIEDPGLPLDAPTRRRQTQVTTTWGRAVRVAARRREWVSPGMNWSEGWRRESVSAQVGIPWGPFRLTPGVERGLEASPQFALATPFRRDWLRADLRWGQGHSVYVRGEVREGVPGDADRLRRSVSFGGRLQPREATRLSFQVNDGAEEAPWFHGTRWINATLDHRLPWGHRLVATYRRLSSATVFVPSDEAFRTDYVIPLGLPLKRQDDEAGRVTVRLRDERRRSIPGLLVRLAGEPRLTDRNGVADFTGLAPGEHYVTIEPRSLGPDRLTVPALPLAVAVVPGRRVEVEAMVVRAARLTGVVRRYHPAAGPPGVTAPPSVLVPAEGVAGVVIELASGSQRRVAVTDRQGRFEFAGLAQGTWRLAVARIDVPAFYQLDTPPSTVTLGPGEAREVELRLIPKPVQTRVSKRSM